MHKVGSGTVTRLLDCSAFTTAYFPRGWMLSGNESRHCAHHSAWSHGLLKMYQNRGPQALTQCLRCPGNARLFVLFRSPLDKIISGIYFWVDGYKNNGTHVITLPELQKVEGSYAFRDSGGYAEYTRTLSFIPGRRRRDDDGVPLTHNDVEIAKQNLKHHFTVGLTENMDSFLALVARELGWPTEAICNVPVHVNTMNRPKTTDLPNELIQYIKKKTAMDSEIHAFAGELHEEQTQRHDGFLETVQEYRIMMANGYCARVVGVRRRRMRNVINLAQGDHKHLASCAAWNETNYMSLSAHQQGHL